MGLILSLVSSPSEAQPEPLLLRPDFVDGQGPPIQRAAVQHGNGLLSFQFGFHLYESEAPEAS